MYDVNVKRISEILKHLDILNQTMRELLDDEEKTFIEDSVRYFAGQRVLQLAIEAITDVGSLLIDGFIMRDPGSYQDIIEIMKDEQVLTADYSDRILRMVSYRKALTQGYLQLDRQELYRWLEEHVEDTQRFPKDIRKYLQQELGT
jgi:uncharacterized protein YutE (UPF0331/DUF86 family)